jgi:hypothetical protein
VERHGDSLHRFASLTYRLGCEGGGPSGSAVSPWLHAIARSFCIKRHQMVLLLRDVETLSAPEVGEALAA